MQTLSKAYENTSSQRTVAPAGRLSETPSRFVIDRLHRDQFTGSLILSHKEKRKKLWFYRGEIIRIQSNMVPELFGHMLIERGWISESDLKVCLDLQKEMYEKLSTGKKLGAWVHELHAIAHEELEELHQFQTVNSILQSLTWDEGVYEYQPADLKSAETPLVQYADVIGAVHALLSLHREGIPNLFKSLKSWQPKSQTVELSQTPLWALLAGCQRTGAHGILTVRKQNRLYEIIIKRGNPLILYEGTFGQPRQTLIVRRTSDEHEKFFVGQLFKLLSFLSGTAHFRSLEESAVERDSFLQIVVEAPSQVTRTLKPGEDPPFELTSEFLVKSTNRLQLWMTKIKSLLKASRR